MAWLCVAVLLALLVAAPAGAVREEPDAADRRVELPDGARSRIAATARLDRGTRGAVFRARQGPGWRVRWNRGTNTAHQVFGGRAAPGRSPRSALDAESAARDVLAAAPDLFGAAGASLERVQARRVGGRWSVVFQQRHEGRRVVGGRAHVVFGADGRLLAAGSDLHAGVTLEAPARVDAGEAAAIAARSLGAADARDREAQPPEEVVLPIRDDAVWRYRLAHRVVLSVVDPPGIFETLVDAQTGEILSRRDLLYRAEIVGNARGDVGNRPASCEGESPRAFASQDILFPSLGVATTDADGDFSIAGASGPTPFSSELTGPFVATTFCEPSGGGADDACELSSALDAFQAGTADPAVPLDLDWSESNSARSERTVFHWVNRAHDELKLLDPGLIGLDTPIPAAVAVPPNLVCPGNAYFALTTQRLFFCAGGATGGTVFADHGELQDVAVHEYGHFATAVLYGLQSPQPPSDLHEGNADILTFFLTGIPELGLGRIEGDCQLAARSADNLLDIRYDWISAGHFTGQILSGMVWETWQALEAQLGDPDLARSRTMELWHEGRALLLPGLGGPATPDFQRDQVLGMFLADDDDGDLSNGTPHYDALCAGAARHGFEGPGPACPPFTTSFQSQGLSLEVWTTGSELGSSGDYATNVAAYVSPAGREYAVVGLADGVAVVEVTPGLASVVGFVAAPPAAQPLFSPTRAAAALGEHAYVATADAAGLVVIDLTGVDAGNIAAATALPGVSFHATPALAADPDSSTLHAAGASSAGGGIQLLDLSDPAAPALAGAFTADRIDALDLRRYESGPNAGRTLLLAVSAVGGEVRLLDVTDPASWFVVSTFNATSLSATHGALGTGDRLLLGNNLDDVLAHALGNGGAVKVELFDVSDPAAPLPMQDVQSVIATGQADSDVVLSGDFALLTIAGEGVRVHDLQALPAAPELGFFATSPEPELRFGAIEVAVTLPSATVLVADSRRGLFALDASPVLPTPACSNGLDDDGDTLSDFPFDPGCASAGDDDERGPGRACDDGLDNDGDGLADFPADPGCRNAVSTPEDPACDDGLDNDADGATDLADPGCDTGYRKREDPQCQDGLDNDGDGGIDWNGGPAGEPADVHCQGPADNKEGTGCGLGFELALPMLGLWLLQRRRRSAPSRSAGAEPTARRLRA